MPINLVREVMDQLVAHGKVERAQLGVLVQDATANDAAYVGLDGIRGVVIQDYGDDASPAKQAGIERGDVVISIDGKPIDRVAELQQAVAFKHPGDEVSVEVARRGGIRKVIKVRLTASDSADTTKLAQSGNGGGAAPSAQNAGAPLGISVRPLTPDLADQYQLTDQIHGLVVTDVDPNGPSAQLRCRTFHRQGQRPRTSLPLFLVEAVSECGGRRLVDDPQHIQPRNLTGLFGRLALGVVKVCGNGDDGFGHLVSE